MGVCSVGVKLLYGGSSKSIKKQYKIFYLSFIDGDWRQEHLQPKKKRLYFYLIKRP